MIMDDGSMLFIIIADKSVELFEVKSLVGSCLVVDENRVKSFQDFFVVDGISSESSQLLQFVVVDVVVVVLIEMSENGSQSVFGLDITNWGRYKINKFFESDWFIFVSEGVNHGVDEGVFA